MITASYHIQRIKIQSYFIIWGTLREKKKPNKNPVYEKKLRV